MVRQQQAKLLAEKANSEDMLKRQHKEMLKMKEEDILGRAVRYQENQERQNAEKARRKRKMKLAGFVSSALFGGVENTKAKEKKKETDKALAEKDRLLAEKDKQVRAVKEQARSLDSKFMLSCMIIRSAFFV